MTSVYFILRWFRFLLTSISVSGWDWKLWLWVVSRRAASTGPLQHACIFCCGIGPSCWLTERGISLNMCLSKRVKNYKITLHWTSGSLWVMWGCGDEDDEVMEECTQLYFSIQLRNSGEQNRHFISCLLKYDFIHELIRLISLQN